MRSVTDKALKLLKIRRTKRRPDRPLIPDGERLFDIAACKCFLGISPDQMSLDRCLCEESPWNQVSFLIYVNQQRQRNLKAWFVTHTRDIRSEDAVAAEAEDTAIERAREDEGDDGAMADIQMEEEEFAQHDGATAHIEVEAIGGDDHFVKDINMDSMSEFMSDADQTELVSADEEEDADGGGQEETAKQRKEDKDYAPRTTTQRNSSCNAPQRCTQQLEASSAVASRYGMSHSLPLQCTLGRHGNAEAQHSHRFDEDEIIVLSRQSNYLKKNTAYIFRLSTSSEQC